MFNGPNFDRKSQLSGILTEPLNPRGPCLLKVDHVRFTTVPIKSLSNQV